MTSDNPLAVLLPPASASQNRPASTKIIRAWIINLLLVVVVFISYWQVYLNTVIPGYSYGGFTLSLEPFKSWPLLLVVFSAFLLPIKPASIDSLFATISIYLMLLPSAVLCMIGGQSDTSFILIAVASVAPLLIVKLLSKSSATSSPTAIRFKTWPLIACVVLTIIATACTAGYRFNLNFMSVYSFRSDFNDALGFPLNYVLPFVGGPLLSLLVSYGCSSKNRGLIAFSLVSSLLLFGFSSHKSYLFGLLLALSLYWASSLKLNLSFVFGSLMICLSTLAVAAADYGGGLLGSLIANRLIFLPPAITYEFLRQFSDIGPLYWAESKLSLGLIQSPLPLNSVNYIAKIMTGLDGVGANSGWISSGYMNLGIAGVVIYAVLIGLILVRFKHWQFAFGTPLVVATMAQPLYNLVASMDLATWLLTGGILPLIVIFFLLERLSLRRQRV